MKIVTMTESLAMLETTGYTPAIVALDVMDKAARIRVLQAELNDFLQRLSPSRRASFQTFIWKYALLRNPLSRLTLLRGIVNRISKKTIDGKTIDGTIPDFQRKRKNEFRR